MVTGQTPTNYIDSIPFHRFISGNKAYTDETKIRQEYRESVQRKRIEAQKTTETLRLSNATDRAV